MGHVSLPWESMNSSLVKGSYPERAAWSDAVVSTIEQNWSSFSKAKDFRQVCPRYESLSKSEKIVAIANLFVWMTKYESSFNPTSRMVETSMGKDPITGKQVASEGLLQLSYQDEQWIKCGFDWSKDKNLADKDPNKTIMDPIRNLKCGVRIMAGHAANDGSKRKDPKQSNEVFLQSPYWAVIRDGTSFVKKANGEWKAIINGEERYTKLPEIASLVQKYYPVCQ